jgi:hypothetical protein
LLSQHLSQHLLLIAKSHADMPFFQPYYNTEVDKQHDTHTLYYCVQGTDGSLQAVSFTTTNGALFAAGTPSASRQRRSASTLTFTAPAVNSGSGGGSRRVSTVCGFGGATMPGGQLAMLLPSYGELVLPNPTPSPETSLAGG